MKKLSSISLIMISMLILFGGQSVFAQATEEKTNVKKEMKQLLKEMPAEMQLEVLRYAERKRDAYVAMEAKKA
ncbi:MAG: hypothetical protein AAFP02_03305, partial [Bacteroidota bacterium]